MKKFENKFFVLCDFASQDINGKLNLLGIFEIINAKVFPTFHPHLFLVGNTNVLDKTIDKVTIEIGLVDEGGKAVVSNIPPLEIKLENKRESVSFNLIYQISNIKFEKAGKYMFVVKGNSEYIGTAEFFVKQSPNDISKN